MGVLLMLMTICGLIVAAVLFVIALYTGKAWLAKFVFGGVAVWFGFYFAMPIGVSLFSKEKTLALNEPKEFCGFYLDCHMHTAVNGVRTAKTIGSKTAKGEFHIVTVKDAAAHRNAGMLIGAVAFPLAAIIFDFISWFCFRRALTGFTKK